MILHDSYDALTIPKHLLFVNQMPGINSKQDCKIYALLSPAFLLTMGALIPWTVVDAVEKK